MSQDTDMGQNAPKNAGQNPNQMSRVEEHQLPSSATFTIATPAVTTILPMTENMTDTSFMSAAASYHQENISDKSYRIENHSMNSTTSNENFIAKPEKTVYASNEEEKSSISQKDDLTVDQSVESKAGQSIVSNTSATAQDDASKLCKKRSKVAKKNTKLDAKSKLEKSRQSARECRARKKLRYQYLEDLVCNREKAVIKLREELSMFCDLSKQIDAGSISDKDKQLLSDQTKENI